MQLENELNERNDSRNDTCLNIDDYAHHLATQSIMKSKELMASTIYVNSMIKRIENRFLKRNSEIRLIPVTQSDNGKMIKLLVDIELKLLKLSSKASRTKLSMRARWNMFKLRMLVFKDDILELLCCIRVQRPL